MRMCICRLSYQCFGTYVPYRKENDSSLKYISHVIHCMLSGPSCEAEGKGSVTYGLGADISLPPCLSERPGIWKLSLLRLKATSGPKSRGASSRYSALARRPEVPSPGPPFFFGVRMRIRFLSPCLRSLLLPATCDAAAQFYGGRCSVSKSSGILRPFEELCCVWSNEVKPQSRELVIGKINLSKTRKAE